MSILLEQALFHRPDREAPRLVARSAGFGAEWLAEAQRIVYGFGDRRAGRTCPLTVFALPIAKKHIAVVRVRDGTTGGSMAEMQFHFLVVARKTYEAWICDPFMLAEKVAPPWDAADTLPMIEVPEGTFTARTLAQVQEVLKRIKSAGLREGEDPEAPDFERTIENSESPALLGGAQILVDGGRLVFERPEGDLRMVSGLWLLLPEMTRCRLWPTSFAFSQKLEFDVLVTPRIEDVVLESYTTEEQAADYPEGTYEYALQHAIESGTQKDLDAVFRRRDGRQTLRLAILVLVLVSALVLVSRWLDIGPPTPSPAPHKDKVGAAALVIGAGDPWTALGVIGHGNMTWNPPEKTSDKK